MQAVFYWIAQEEKDSTLSVLANKYQDTTGMTEKYVAVFEWCNFKKDYIKINFLYLGMGLELLSCFLHWLMIPPHSLDITSTFLAVGLFTFPPG